MSKIFDDNIIFSFEITNAYIFKQIFNIHSKLNISSVPFYFKEDGITILTGSTSKANNRRVIIDIEIDGDEILEYYLNKELCSVKISEDNEYACHIEQLDINMLIGILKSIQKATSLQIYKTTNNDEISINIKHTTTEKTKMSCGKFQEVEYDINRFQNISPQPNVKVDINQFCNGIKSMTRGDPEYVSFKIFPEGLIIESKNNNETVIKDWFSGIIKEDYDETDYVETKVNTNMIKSLSKINTMLTNSIVKIYSEENGYLKISHRVADYGENHIYFIDGT